MIHIHDIKKLKNLNKLKKIKQIKEKMNERMKVKILALSAIFFWATSYIATKVVLWETDSITFGIIRYYITAIALIIYLLFVKTKKPEPRDLPYFILSGLSGFSLYMLFFNKGITMVSTSTASVIIASAPIITGVLSSILLKEQLSPYKWLFICISFLGIIILTLWEGVFSFNMGIFYLLVPATLMAFYNILQRKLIVRYTPAEATIYSMLFGSIILILYSPESILEFPSFSLRTMLLIIYCAIFVGVVGYLLWSRAFVHAEKVSDVANFMFLTPFLVTIIGILFLNERLTKATIIGGLLIMLGLIGYNVVGGVNKKKNLK